MNDYRWLLEIDGAGPVRRWAEDDVEVSDNAGNTYFYRSGLAALELAASEESVDIGIVDETDWPSLADSLHGTRVVLYRWAVGSVLEQADVYARGRVDDLEYGAIGEPASFTIGDERNVDIPPMPDRASRVTSETFPLTDSTGFVLNEAASQSYYPSIFGHPGHLEEFGLTFPLATLWVVPVPVAQINETPAAGLTFEPHYVVAEDPQTANPSTVWLATLGADNGPTAILYETDTAIVQDELGRSILTANAGPNGEALPDAESRVYAGFPPGQPGLRNAFEVISYVCGRWAPDSTDFARLRDVEGDLSRFMIDTWFNQDVEDGAWTWITALIEFMPFEIRTGGFGRYLIRKKATVDAALTRRTIDPTDGDVVLVSPVTYSGRPFSTVTCVYADLGEKYHTPFWGAITYGPEAGEEPTPYRASTLQEVRAHGLLASSLARYGTRSLEFELPWTWDRPTAALVAEWQIEQGAVPHRRVSYLLPERWGLREGDQVRITDADVGLNHLALVDEPPLVGSEGMTIEFRIPGDSYGS